MRFHVRVFFIFLAINIVLIGGGLLLGVVLWTSGAMIEEDQAGAFILVGSVIWVVLCMAISSIAVVLAYVLRALMPTFRSWLSS